MSFLLPPQMLWMSTTKRMAANMIPISAKSVPKCELPQVRIIRKYRTMHVPQQTMMPWHVVKSFEVNVAYRARIKVTPAVMIIA